MIRIVLGILNLIYFVFLSIRGISFSKFFLLAGLFFVIWGFVKIKLGHELNVRYHKPVMAFNVFMALILVSFIIMEGFIIIEGNKKKLVKTDYVVVLGAGLWGETPSDTLYKRLDAALEYIKKNPEVKIVLSGGQGPGETITEAEAMKRYMLSKGIDEKKILKEEKSTSTEQNINYTRQLIDNLEKSENVSITVVTSNFHMLRAKLLANKAGFKTYGYSAPVLSWLIPTCYIREYFAMVKYLIF